MTTGDRIPDHNNVARYCKPTQIGANGDVQATAFMLRTDRRDEVSLSVNWLEFLNGASRRDQIETLRETYRAKGLSVSRKAKIAVLNVGEVCQKARMESLDSRNLSVLHDPTPPDPSHSGIYNLMPDNELIAELIVEIVRETHPARV